MNENETLIAWFNNNCKVRDFVIHQRYQPLQTLADNIQIICKRYSIQSPIESSCSHAIMSRHGSLMQRVQVRQLASSVA
jgi:hypothetical protein